MRDYSYYLDEAKKKQGFKYDKDIDKALGFKAAMACQLRKGKNTISEDKMIELCELGGIDPEMGVMDSLSWKMSSNRTREIMQSILQKLPQMACLAIAVCVIFTSSTSPSSAMQNLSSKNADNIEYGNKDY